MDVPISFWVAASKTAPSGSSFINVSGFWLINLCIALASDFERLAAASVNFLTGIPIASAIISGAKLPSFLNVSLSVGTSFNFSFTSLFTLETTSEGNKLEGFIF